MSPDVVSQRKYGSNKWSLIIPALLFLTHPLYPQTRVSRDSISANSPDKIIHIPGFKSLVPENAFINNPENLVPARIEIIDQTPVLFDSLKLKASRHNLTQKLYDFMVVPAKPTSGKAFTLSSERDFQKFTGYRIRNIEIKRLGVFGSDIKNPDSLNPNKIENLLNKTHVNTNEFIIRKNLLFSPGDTISPLILSDNERLLRQLPFIEDSRIIVVPISDREADIIVLTKDVYSLGASFQLPGIKKGEFSLFDKNIIGIGHELRWEIPYNSDLAGSPGFGISYKINNITRTFINLNLYYLYGLGKKTYGFDLERKLVSSTTKYAGGISVREMFTTEDLDTLLVAEPLKYNLQDYWLLRSFLVNEESVSRLILGARYTNNNVFDRPFILPNSYHYLQKYRILLGSVSFSTQKYYKTNLIYSFGPTEDIPYGELFNVTFGREINEFKKRTYASINLSVGKSVRSLGYFYSSVGLSSFFNKNQTEQGLFLFRTNFFSNLINMGNYRIRNFVKFDYTRGFDRNYEELLVFTREGGFSGFSNDSVGGKQRLSLNLESVFFSPANFYGFRFAFFAFGDLAYLYGTNQFVSSGEILSSVGIGVRIRNSKLVFNTFQIRIGFYPNLPPGSRVNYFSLSGVQLFNPNNFDPGPPSINPFQ